MKKAVKLISTIFMAVAILYTLTTFCFATTTVGEVNIPAGTAANTTVLAQSAANVVRTIKNIAAIAAVIIIAILGIKYMLGSVEERADYKKSFVPLIVGVAVVVLATQIASFLFKVL